MEAKKQQMVLKKVEKIEAEIKKIKEVLTADQLMQQHGLKKHKY